MHPNNLLTANEVKTRGKLINLPRAYSALGGATYAALRLSGNDTIWLSIGTI